MIRAALLALFWVFVGILVGEIPNGATTVGRTAWNESNKLLNQGSTQLQSLVSYAGIGDGMLSKWLPKAKPEAKPAAPTAAPAPAPKATRPPPIAPSPLRRVEQDHEGLSSIDKEALRQILE